MPGQPADAYVAGPAAGARATVVVLQAWFGGLTAVVTGVCDDLPGWATRPSPPTCIAVRRPRTGAEARALRVRKRSRPIRRQIIAPIDWARSAHGAEALARIGFSAGGQWALWLAKQSRPEIPPISATTVFYATRAGDFPPSRSASRRCRPLLAAHGRVPRPASTRIGATHRR